MDRPAKLRTRQRTGCVNLLRQFSNGIHGRREIAVCSQQIGCVISVADRETDHINREEHIDRLLHEDRRLFVAFGDRAEIRVDRWIDLRGQVRKIFAQISGRFIGRSAWLDSSEMNRDSRIGVLQAGEKTALLRVERRIVLLADLADVVTSAGPLAWSQQLLRDLPIVQTRTILHADFAERVVPVVAIDKN